MKPINSTEDSPHSSNWILGIFYYNKNDDRLFPPKRIKYLGWTINFANPYSIAAMILLIITIFGIYYLFNSEI